MALRTRALELGRPLLLAAAAVGTIALSLAASVALHANTPLARRVLARLASDAASSVLGGRVVIETPSELGPSRIVVPLATLSDSSGTRVLSLSDVRVDVSLRRVAEELLFDRARPTIVVNHVRVERADVTLVADPQTGVPTIAQALAPKAGPPGKGTTNPGEGLRVYLPVIEVGRARAHSRLQVERPLEADVHGVQGLLLVTPKGVAVDVKRFGVVLQGFGEDARGTGTFAVRAPGPVRATFEGFFGDIELKAQGSLEGSRVEGSVDAPRVTPRAASALVPGWPVGQDVSAHLDVEGDFPDLAVNGVLRFANGTLAGKGNVTLRPPEHADFDVTATHLDARLVAPGMPPTDLGVDAHVAVRMEEGKPTIGVVARTQPTAVLGQLVPAADVRATFRDGVTTGSADVHEPGVPLTVEFTVQKTGAADVTLDSGPVNLARLPRLPIVGLEGAARVRGRAHVESGKIRATFDGDVRKMAARGVSVSHARVAADVAVPLADPTKVETSVKIQGEDALLGTIAAKHVTLDARGTPPRLSFDAHADDGASTELGATGAVWLGEHVVVRGTKVSLRRDPVLIEGEVQELDPDSRRIDVRNIRVAGAGGSLTGSARLGRDLVEVEAEGQGIDLAALARALGLPRGTMEGTLRVSTNVAVGHDVTRGKLRVGLGGATLGMIAGLSGQLTANLEDERIDGEASGLVNGLGTFGATWNGELAGPAFDPSSWERAKGEAEVQIGNVRLGLLSVLLPREGPVARIGGEGFARILLSRKDEKLTLPDVFATVGTRGFVMDLRRKSGDVHVAGIDVTATGAFSGATGDSTGTTLLSDAKGGLASGSGAIKVDVARLVDAPSSALAQLVDTPVDAILSLPPRSIADLPDLVRPEGLAGTVSVNANVKGTLSHPTLFVSAEGLGLGSESAPLSRPVDARATAQYEWTTREVSGRSTLTVDGREAATATVRGVVPEGPLADFRGEGHVDLMGVPLDLLSTAGRARIAGVASGSASFSRKTEVGALTADVRLDDVAVDDSPLGQGRFSVRTDGRAVTAKVGFVGERGRLDADATTDVAWDHGYPTVAEDAPLSAHLLAREFSAAVLAPFVRSVLTRVGGRLDANLTATFPAGTLAPSASTAGMPVGRFGIQGTATLTEGQALVETLGLDVRDLGAELSAHGENGETNVSIRDAHGRVRSSRDNLTGSAELVLSGLRVTSGTGELSAQDLPVLFHGAPQGRVTGSSSFRLSRDGEVYLIQANVENLVAALPESSTRAVIDLAQNEDVTVVQEQNPEEGASTPSDFVVTVYLGNGVRLRRTHVDLGVSGAPIVYLGKETEVVGSVDIAQGSAVPVLGKPFLIEHGRVIFDTGRPQNPRLDVTASWRSPTDTTVLVDVTGTLEEPQISLRSDPPLPESEVAALVLGSGTNIAAQSLTQLVSENPIELRVESTAESKPRYTAAVPVGRNLWFEASTYQQSQMNPSASGTDRNVYSGTVDYRFAPRWSLRTEAGTAGGALDLLWQYRY